MKKIDAQKYLNFLNEITIVNEHKYDFGNVLIIAGDTGMHGAALLSAEAALESGAGLVTVATCQEVVANGYLKRSEIMFINKDALDEKKLEKYDVIGFGPGLIKNEENLKILTLVLKMHKHIIIDATGIRILKQIPDFEQYNIVITPHAGEYYYLFDTFELPEIENNLIIVYKSHQTQIIQGNNVYQNITGNYKMGTAGMGDALLGMIVAMIAQFDNTKDGTMLATYLHTELANELSKSYYKVTPKLLIENINAFINKKIKDLD